TPAETTSSAHEHDALATRAPQPGLDQLQHLVDGFRQAGLRVQFTESGVVSGDATHQLAVFRISQEALTNALRYAGRGAEARIVIAHLKDRTTIKVTDSGRIGSSAAEIEETSATLPGSGRGLAGAAERARLFGGSLEAGPHGAGWRVRATVPIGTAVQDTLMRREGGEDE